MNEYIFILDGGEIPKGKRSKQRLNRSTISILIRNINDNKAHKVTVFDNENLLIRSCTRSSGSRTTVTSFNDIIIPKNIVQRPGLTYLFNYMSNVTDTKIRAVFVTGHGDYNSFHMPGFEEVLDEGFKNTSTYVFELEKVISDYDWGRIRANLAEDCHFKFLSCNGASLIGHKTDFCSHKRRQSYAFNENDELTSSLLDGMDEKELLSLIGGTITEENGNINVEIKSKDIIKAILDPLGDGVSGNFLNLTCSGIRRNQTLDIRDYELSELIYVLCQKGKVAKKGSKAHRISKQLAKNILELYCRKKEVTDVNIYTSNLLIYLSDKLKISVFGAAIGVGQSFHGFPPKRVKGNIDLENWHDNFYTKIYTQKNKENEDVETFVLPAVKKRVDAFYEYFFMKSNLLEREEDYVGTAGTKFPIKNYLGYIKGRPLYAYDAGKLYTGQIKEDL